MNALDEQDFLILYLALDMLSKHTDNELAKASSAMKKMAMQAMRQQIASVRGKLGAMQI